MLTQRFLTATAAILALTACGAFQHSPAVQVSAQDMTLNTRWHANLASPANLAGVVQMNGSASMAPSPDSSGTNVTLDLANASPGGLHPWAIHYGQCGDNMDRGVFGALEMYSPLKVGSDGLATGTTSLQMQTPRTGSYFAVVYASVANPETVVACGNLAPPTQ